jgi:drug/metabolite transporter (DMT)-like permease
VYYLIITVLLNVVVSSVLKLFSRYNINTLQAITFNYCICVVTGILSTGVQPFNQSTIDAPYFPYTVMMGMAFIAIFILTAFCTKVSGMTATVIASKLSLVIPVLFAILVLHETTNAVKLSGVLLAFPAVYLANGTNDNSVQKNFLLWPAILFVMSGCLDTYVNLIQKNYLLTPHAQAAGTIICFATAAVIGLLITGGKILAGNIQFHYKNILGGIALGVPNFFSIYFLIKTLNSSPLQSSATIPVVNISILVASTITAILLFGEAKHTKRIAGLVLAILAITLIAMGDINF